MNGEEELYREMYRTGMELGEMMRAAGLASIYDLANRMEESAGPDGKPAYVCPMREEKHRD